MTKLNGVRHFSRQRYLKLLNWNAKMDVPWQTNVEPESEIVPDAMIPIFGSAMWKKLDANNDGVVDARDLSLFRSHFNTNVY